MYKWIVISNYEQAIVRAESVQEICNGNYEELCGYVGDDIQAIIRIDFNNF